VRTVLRSLHSDGFGLDCQNISFAGDVFDQ
jgi:hypothetical protein